MLLRLIVPAYYFNFGMKFKTPMQNLTLMHLAALTPDDVEVEIVDENINEIPFDNKADMVGITYTCSTYKRAFDIADKYRALGVPVILGGHQATLFPEEAVTHADAVVIGEAENVWHDLFKDFKMNHLKQYYKSDVVSDLKGMPVPRYDFYDLADCFNTIPLFATRGCPYKCTYCSYWKDSGVKLRKRPVADIVEHIKVIKGTYHQEDQIPPLNFSIMDDNVWGDPQYAKELFRALKSLDIIWGGQASFTLDKELIELASDSGCKMMIVGLESLEQRNLDFFNKKHNQPELFGRFVDMMHQADLTVVANFMVGLPYDGLDCFDNIIRFLESNYVESACINVFTPYRGTEYFHTQSWAHKDKCDDFDHVLKLVPIYTPKGMTKKQFRRSFVDFMRRVFSDAGIEHRLKYCNFPVPYSMNQEIQQMYNDPILETWVNTVIE